LFVCLFCVCNEIGAWTCRLTSGDATTNQHDRQTGTSVVPYSQPSTCSENEQRHIVEECKKKLSTSTLAAHAIKGMKELRIDRMEGDEKCGESRQSDSKHKRIARGSERQRGEKGRSERRKGQWRWRAHVAGNKKNAKTALTTWRVVERWTCHMHGVR